MVTAFLLLLAASSASVISDFAGRIAAIEARIGGRMGVAAVETGSGKRLDYRSKERFPMCSTFKFLAAAAVLKRVDEKQETLDRFISYDAKEILEYAPVTKIHLADGGMTLGALCAAAIEQSDNTAANLLLDTISGPAGLTNFARTLGDQVTRLDRVEPELNSAIPGDERDTTTPAAMCLDMQKLLLGEVLSEASRHQLEEWLHHNDTGGSMIRAGVPKNWIVGNKTGRGVNGATNVLLLFGHWAGRHFYLQFTSSARQRRQTIVLPLSQKLRTSVWSFCRGEGRPFGISQMIGSARCADRTPQRGVPTKNSLPEFRRCAIRKIAFSFDS